MLHGSVWDFDTSPHTDPFENFTMDGVPATAHPPSIVHEQDISRASRSSMKEAGHRKAISVTFSPTEGSDVENSQRPKG